MLKTFHLGLWPFVNFYGQDHLWLPAVHCTEAAWPSGPEVGHSPEVGHNPGVGQNLEGGRLQTLPPCNLQGQTCRSLKCAGIFRSMVG